MSFGRGESSSTSFILLFHIYTCNLNVIYNQSMCSSCHLELSAQPSQDDQIHSPCSGSLDSSPPNSQKVLSSSSFLLKSPVLKSSAASTLAVGPARAVLGRDSRGSFAVLQCSAAYVRKGSRWEGQQSYSWPLSKADWNCMGPPAHGCFSIEISK